jgi:hypothetical protein
MAPEMGKKTLVTRFTQFDVVRLRFGMPEYSIPPGSEAAVLDVFPAGYEIEVVNAIGDTLYLGGADDSDLEPLTPAVP